MVKAFMGSLFATRKRTIIIVFKDPTSKKKMILTHVNKELFFLQKHEDVATAARLILHRGFECVFRRTDIHTYGYKSFEQDGVEYHIVYFDGPVVVEAGVDGYEKLKKEGFEFIMSGDHPLSPKINKAMGRK